MIDLQQDHTTPRKRNYLYEVDFMRILFISGVLLNHTVNIFTSAMNSTSMSYDDLRSIRLMIHFSRMGFMFMSGLVLTMNYYNNHNWHSFWKKRFNGSIWTYLIWNLIIFSLSIFFGVMHAPHHFLITYVGHLFQGDLQYMYYLLVTMQLYLVFPIITWLFHKWPNHHKQLLVISFIVQLALTSLIKYKLWYVDTSHWPYWFHAYSINVFTYQFFFIFGAYASQHYNELTKFVNKHIKIISIIFAGLSLGTIPFYRILNLGILQLNSDHARSAYQPYLMVFDTMAILFIFWLGKRYASWRATHPAALFSRVIGTGAKISFGIYLDQIIGLLLLEWVLAQLSLPDLLLLLLVPIGWLFVLAISFIIAWIFYKVSPFGFLIGRPQLHWRDINKFWRYRTSEKEN